MAEATGGKEQTNESLEIKAVGDPPVSVVDSVARGVIATMQHMGYSGKLPKIIVASGAIVGKDGKQFAGVYNFTEGAIKIGVAKLRSLFDGSDHIPTDEEIAIFTAAEEAAHFVQDQQGRLPHVDNRDDADKPSHYQTPHEIEAARVAIAVANRLVPGIRFSREGIN